MPRNVSDITRAREVLGYSPVVSLRDGLERTVGWFRAACEPPRSTG